MSKNNYIYGLICIIFIAIIFYCNQKSKEGFVSGNNIEQEVLQKYMDESLDGLSDEEYKQKIANLRARLARFGLYPSANSPDMSKYVLKSQMNPDDGKCVVASAEDRDKYILKSAVPEPKCPGVDMSKYVLKTSIQPEKICPPPKEVDMSKYVLKTTIPPAQKCPPCICPKVKVSGRLCKACPPPPKAKCPEVKPCPNVTCPEPKPCPPQSAEKCHSVKYVKVPLVLKKTVKVNERGEIVDETEEPSSTSGFRTILDSNGKPMLNSEGRPILIDEDGKRVVLEGGVKPVLDSNGNPILDKDGKPVLVDNDGSSISLNNAINDGPVASNDVVQNNGHNNNKPSVLNNMQNENSELLNNKNNAYLSHSNLQAYNPVGKPLSDAISSNLADQNNASLNDNANGASSLNEINNDDAMNNGNSNQLFNANTRATKQVNQPHFNSVLEKPSQPTVGGHVLNNQPTGMGAKCGPVKFNDVFKRYGVYGTQYQN